MAKTVELTCHGRLLIVLFSPSMNIRKFAAISLLVFGTIAANDVAPSNSELEAMYDRAYRAFDAADYVQALKNWMRLTRVNRIWRRRKICAASSTCARASTTRRKPPYPKPEGSIRNFGMPVSIWRRSRF